MWKCDSLRFLCCVFFVGAFVCICVLAGIIKKVGRVLPSRTKNGCKKWGKGTVTRTEWTATTPTATYCTTLGRRGREREERERRERGERDNETTERDNESNGSRVEYMNVDFLNYFSGEL